MRLGVIVATYNEKDSIEALIRKIFATPLPEGHQPEILVIDDSSQDGTGEILERVKKEFPGKLHVFIRKERNRATAALDGFRRALELRVDFILEMDGDLSHDPKYLPQFVSFIRFYDVVIGSRYVEGGGVKNWPLSRKVISACSNFIYRLILGTKIHDLSGGFKCYRREVIASLNLDEFYSRGYAIGVETLFRCYKKGYSFLEIPILFQNRSRGTSKFKLKEATHALQVVFRLFLTHGRAFRLFD